jgi:hypothetical protein
MTMFSSTASPGQRWKLFLPGAASAQCDALSVSTAAAFFRSQWLSEGAAGFHRRHIASSRRSPRADRADTSVRANRSKSV